MFLAPSHPLLNSPAQPISVEEITSEPIQSIIETMLTIAQGERHDPKKRSMVGLAAPQIGINRCIILVDVGIGTDRKSFGHIKVYINPIILWMSEEQELDREGCFSVDRNVAGAVPRAKHIKLQAYDREANLVTEEHSDYTARIFQHEIDHLHGIRFPERVGEHGSLFYYEADQIEDFRLNWRTWPNKCPWDTWLKMKAGLPYQLP